jgi:hypothetical protein
VLYRWTNWRQALNQYVSVAAGRASGIGKIVVVTTMDSKDRVADYRVAYSSTREKVVPKVIIIHAS